VLPFFKHGRDMKLKDPEIRFEVTNKCNYKCIMCPRELQTRKQGDMSIELFKKIFDEGLTIGMKQATLVSYGEPFADKKFLEKVKYARQKSPETELYVITNGSYVNEDIADALIDYEFDKIRFSWYGVSRESYGIVHGVDNKYKDIVTKNIEYLISERDRRGKSKPHIEVYFLQMKENEHEVEEFKQQWLGVADDVSIWKPHNWSDGRDYRDLDLLGEKSSCGRPDHGPVQVQWNGEIVPCCWDYNNQIILGDVSINTVEEVLKGSKFDALRQAHDSKKFYKFPFCDSCDQLHHTEDALVFTTIKTSKVGKTNTNQFELEMPALYT
jgi:pyruvate-formate lyase-activating enzyme